VFVLQPPIFSILWLLQQQQQQQQHHHDHKLEHVEMMMEV
jgi:hypothetical protein